MEANIFARLASYQFLPLLFSFTLFSLSNPMAASACNSTIPSYSNQTSYNNNNTNPYYFHNTTGPYYSQNTTNSYYSQNTTIPYYSQNTTNPYYSQNTTNPYYSQNTTNPSNQTSDKNSSYSTTIPSTQTFKTFILKSCNSSTYASICYQSLSPYASKIEADPLKLCNFSLSLALKATRTTSSIISELLKNNNLTQTAAEVVQDCLDNVKDSIEELKQALDAMGHLDDIDREFQISSIQTWVSAAISDDETCSDGFDEFNVDASVRDKIRKSVLNVERMTSNALYFINNLAY